MAAARQYSAQRIAQRAIGFRLRDARFAAQMTAEEVAEALGIDRSTLSKWETGANTVSVVDALRLAQVYRIGIEELVGPLVETLTDDDDKLLEDLQQARARYMVERSRIHPSRRD